MHNRLVITCSLVIYVAAMCVSLTAHDPFHAHHHGDHDHHEQGHLEQSHDKAVAHHDSHEHGKHTHKGHSHKHHSHKQHSHEHSDTESTSDSSTEHDHDHDCPVCEFLTLKCLEASIAEVESASELIELAQSTAVNYHTAFSPYRPPSRAPPAC